jgi:excisionase family DNA binding protein
MDKEAAAKILGVSTRTLQRYTTQGKISVTYRHGKTGAEADYDESELQRFKKQQESTTYQPAQPAANEQSQALAPIQIPTTTIAGAERLAAVLELLQQPPNRQSVPIESKLTLSLIEAATLAGLSRHHLLGAIKEKKLKARKIGRGWRMKRADLDSYIQKF